MKTTFTLTILLFLTIMLGMALSSSKQLTTEESSTPTRYWFKSPTGVEYSYTCIEGVKYLTTKLIKGSTNKEYQYTYTNMTCDG